jgi:predicted transcriptional regulator
MCPMPTQTDTVLHLRAGADLVRRIDNIAAATDRSRHYIACKLLEQSLTAPDRLHALEEIAAAGLEANAAERAACVRGPNPGEIISESSTDGHARLNAMQKIAAGNRK